MSIDYINYDYPKVAPYTNVMNEIRKDRPGGDKSFISGDLEILIRKLSLRHPEWMFVGEDSWWDHSNTGYRVRRFRVYEGNDILGTVSLESGSYDKFEIRNTRIASAMNKRNYKSTKDVTIAIKTIDKYFSSKTVSERVSETRSKTTNAINHKMWNSQRHFNTVMEKLAPALATYVVLHMDKVRPILESYGASPSALDDLSGRNEARKLHNSIAQARSTSQGTTVMLHGDRYLLLHDSEEAPRVVTASQLDEDMRTKLGILKVVGDEEAIESVGMRISATTFYLLP